MAERRGARIHFAKITPQATIETDSLVQLIAEKRPKIVAVTLLSNAFGSITDWQPVATAARAVGALLLADAAQAVVHIPVDVQKLDVDYLAFSGHKIYGPTGIGVLYVREGVYELMRPFLGGGDMIERVTIAGSTYAQPPQMFEAGTPAIGEAVALGAAIDFIERIGVHSIAQHENKLVEEAIEQLRAEPGVTVFGPGDVGRRQSSIVSFNVAGVHAHDIASVADSFNVQIRAGTHCAMPALDSLGVGSTARLSVGVYSCNDDIEQLVQAIRETRRLFL
jgi:cysteine desulfurase/selenocysteine lyase